MSIRIAKLNVSVVAPAHLPFFTPPRSTDHEYRP